jgi:presenilin-like A22 family membrane protease
MKYKLKVVVLIVLFFLVSQLVGVLVTSSYKENFYKKEVEEKNFTIMEEENKTLPKENFTNISITREFIPQKVEIKTTFDFLQILISFLIALVIATIIFIILMKIGVVRVMRFWLFFVVAVGLFITFSLLLYNINFFQMRIKNLSFSIVEIFALVMAIALAYFKIYRRNIILHNLTEIFVYPGIMVLFLPIVNIYITIALLVIISVYDFIAVFKTRHMQKMAQFMIKDIRAFTGFFLPWLDKAEKEKIKKLSLKKSRKKIRIKVNIAALGGGDIVLPMLFSSVVFLTHGLMNSLLIVLFSALSLLMLMIFGEREKAYPALPPLTLGCLIGYAISLLI